jgi:hypothetical protein
LNLASQAANRSTRRFGPAVSFDETVANAVVIPASASR